MLVLLVAGTWAGDVRDKTDFRNTVRFHDQVILESHADVFQHLPRIPLTWTTGTGFKVPDPPEVAVYTFNPETNSTVQAESDNIQAGIAGAGVTIWVPRPKNLYNDDLVFGIQNVTTSGTTDGVIWVEGLPIDSLSSTTRSGKDLDAFGDIVWLQLKYNSTCSAFVINEMIH